MQELKYIPPVIAYVEINGFPIVLPVAIIAALVMVLLPVALPVCAIVDRREKKKLVKTVLGIYLIMCALRGTKVRIKTGKNKPMNITLFVF